MQTELKESDVVEAFKKIKKTKSRSEQNLSIEIVWKIFVDSEIRKILKSGNSIEKKLEQKSFRVVQVVVVRSDNKVPLARLHYHSIDRLSDVFNQMPLTQFSAFVVSVIGSTG